MIEISAINVERNVGKLTDDLAITGTNADVRAVVPQNESVEINVSGTNTTVEIGGRGHVSLIIMGTNADVILTPSLNSSITAKGSNISIKTESMPDLTERVDNTGSTQSINNIVNISTGNGQANTGMDEGSSEESYDTAVYKPGTEKQNETRTYKNENSQLKCDNCGAMPSDQDQKYCAECGTKF